MATLPFRFVSGVAEVPELSASRLAALSVKGWSVIEEPEVPESSAVDAAAAMVELAAGSKRKAKPKKDFELNEDVPVEDMEVPEPEIG